jgi:hypothetical protein
MKIMNFMNSRLPKWQFKWTEVNVVFWKIILLGKPDSSKNTA